MKTMTCRQLGGPCDAQLHGEKADDVIKAQDAHLKEMVAGGDETHTERARGHARTLEAPRLGTRVVPGDEEGVRGASRGLTASGRQPRLRGTNSLERNESAMSDNTETAILAGGCFWGVQELLRQREGVISTRVGYTGGRERQPDVPQPSRSRRGRRDRLRPRAHLLPGHPGVLLPDPRSDDQGPSGQRHRLDLPLGDLLHERRAAPGRRGDDRRRRRLRPVARQGRDRDQRGRPLLGGRARAPGLPPAHPERLHLPLPAGGLEAAAPRDRRLERRRGRLAPPLHIQSTPHRGA